MTCIKTGAVVKFPEYSTRVPCDLYEVGDCIVIRFFPNLFYGSSNRAVTHEAYIHQGYQDKNAGIVVVPKSQIKEIHHG